MNEVTGSHADPVVPILLALVLLTLAAVFGVPGMSSVVPASDAMAVPKSKKIPMGTMPRGGRPIG